MAYAKPESMRSVALYVLLTVVFSAPFWLVIAQHGMGDWRSFGLMWCPGAAGIATALLTRRSLRTFGWTWPGWRFMAAGYFIPVAYAATAYCTVWLLGLGSLDLSGYAAKMHYSIYFVLPLASTIGVLTTSIKTLGEEIGWRGYLVPALLPRLGAFRTAIVSGLIWAAWHVPLIVFADYHGHTPAWYSLSCFAVLVVADSFIFTWARIASGSIWPCVLLHSAHNAWVQAIFTPLTGDTGNTAWYIDEFGAALAITVIIAAVMIWRWRPLDGLKVKQLSSLPQAGEGTRPSRERSA